MRIHFIQHVPFEYPGLIKNWAEEHQYITSYTKVFQTALFPSTEEFDMLVILGGPMGVYEEAKYDWMKAEKSFIKKSIAEKKKVLGICLGAQLIAKALDAKVYPHTTKEIGWFEVEKVALHPLTDHLPQTFITFHWHGDTFTLPHGAIHLFKTKACKQQGFVYSDHVAGLQFHMEVKDDLLNGMTENEKAELIKDDHVQTEDEIKQKAKHHINNQKSYIYDFLNLFAN